MSAKKSPETKGEPILLEAPTTTEHVSGRGKNEKERFCVYIGPSILGLIQSGTVYTGTRLQVLQGLAHALERYPLIATLLVEDESLSEDRMKVKTPGNLLYVNYKKLASGKK